MESRIDFWWGKSTGGGMSTGFPTGVANMGGTPQNLMRGLSQNMREHRESLKLCRKIPVKELIR